MGLGKNTVIVGVRINKDKQLKQALSDLRVLNGFNPVMNILKKSNAKDVETRKMLIEKLCLPLDTLVSDEGHKDHKYGEFMHINIEGFTQEDKELYIEKFIHNEVPTMTVCELKDEKVKLLDSFLKQF